MTEPRPTQSAPQVRQTMTGLDTRQTQVVALDDEAIVDVRSAANVLGYVSAAVGRHRRLVVVTSGLTFALVVALALLTPRSYRIESRILTHKSSVMSALVHPDRAIPQSADAPTAGAVELVKSRANLEDLLLDTNLEKLWEDKRSRIGRTKDALFAKVFGAPKKEDLHEAYLKMLDEKVEAHVEGEMVLLNVEWPNAEVAMRLAESLVARFLTMRHDMELGEISQSVNILGRNVEESRGGIDVVVKRMQKVLEDRETDLQVRAGAPRSEARHRVHKSRYISIRKPVAVNAAEPVAPGGPGSELRRQLAEKQTALSVMKRAYEDRVRRAEDELNNLRASLGPDHPDVREAKHKLDALAKDAPTQVGALEADSARLATQVGALPPDPTPAPATKAAAQEPEEQRFDLMRVPVSEDLYKEMDKDPEVTAVLDELKKRQDGHDELVRRLNSARIESETANVAFDYRYKLTSPPVFPTKPVKPNVPVMVGGGAFAALALGFLLALLADLTSGRLLESWQVERFLKVKMLGEIEEP